MKKKKVVRLTENDLTFIIKEELKKILSEDFEDHDYDDNRAIVCLWLNKMKELLDWNDSGKSVKGRGMSGFLLTLARYLETAIKNYGDGRISINVDYKK